MTSPSIAQPDPPSPSLSDTGTVQVHALSAGHLTLPEKFFVHPASDMAKSTVPSLAFLIQHENPMTGQRTNMVFDLGLRRDINRYPDTIQRHAATRKPLTTDPDVVKSLAAGGLGPDDIDFVIYSHVHWDHIGEPQDFQQSIFVVGHGTLDLLGSKPGLLKGGHSFFEADLLPPDRTIQLADPKPLPVDHKAVTSSGYPNFAQDWSPYDHFPHAMDVFGDGSLYVIDAPGHLPGHINLLCKTETGQRVYLAGDACHDRRIVRAEKSIGEWEDEKGNICCIHSDRKQAEKTIDRIRKLEEQGVEIVFAHDVEWEQNPSNRYRFFAKN